MARIKLAGSKKTKSGAGMDMRRAFPCLFAVLLGIGLLLLIFYLALQSASQ